MSLSKRIKDNTIRFLFGKEYAPSGLFELSEYFRHHGPISFESTQLEDGTILAVSTNFRYGSIVTTGKDKYEVDKKIKDAILTSFEIPCSFAKEADIKRVQSSAEEQEYALA